MSMVDPRTSAVNTVIVVNGQWTSSHSAMMSTIPRCSSCWVCAYSNAVMSHRKLSFDEGGVAVHEW